MSLKAESQLLAEIPADRCARIAWAASALTMGVGVGVLVGWTFQLRALMTVLPGFVAMKPNTAVACCWAGLSLFLYLRSATGSHRRARQLSQALAGAVAMLGALTLGEYASGVPLGIDELIFADYVSGLASYAPGRMAPITAANFVALGLALALLHSPGKKGWAQGFTLVVALSSLLALVGYFYGVAELYQSGHATAVALHTAAAFFTLCVGVWCATSDCGFMPVITGPGASGMLVRRYGLAVLVLPLFFGWLRLQGERAGCYGSEFGSALVALANVATFATLIWVGARSLRTAESDQVEVQESLLEARLDLETRVVERTMDLAEANFDLDVEMSRRAEAEHANQQIMDNSLDVICTFDAEGRFLQVSRACEAVWGYRPEELIGNSFLNFVHPDDVPKTIATDRSILEGQRFTDFENRYLHRNGSVVTMLWTARWSEEHQINFCVARDITARKRIEVEFKHIAAIVASSHDAILSKKLDGTILSWNPASEALYGYTAAEAIGSSVTMLLPAAAAAEEAQIIARIKADEFIDQYESVRMRKDGTLVDVSLTISAVKDTTGRIIGASKIARDITARKQAERELLRAKEAAEAANRAKSEFLANMSHEIRTPMNGILGMTELVLDSPLQDDQREYLGMAKTSAHALLRLINDILDFSKIEAGKLQLEAIPFGLRHVLATMLKPLRVRAEQRNLQLETEIHEDVPEHLVGDPLRLRQVLINLLDNAIKFTECGSVRLCVAVAPTLFESQDITLIFSVTDTGIGIAEEKRELIFDAFAQADGTMTRTHGGTGLGLAISSQLVQKMRGQLWLDSAEGQGTTFHFTACLGLDPAPAAPPAPEENKSMAASQSESQSLRILLADDNLINRALAAGLLEKRGHLLTQAVNGRDAVAAAIAGDFDLVLMDVQMPEMDGFEATRLIRGLELGTGRRTPIAALTAHALAGDRERCLTAGMDDYLTKPLQKAALLPLLERISADRSTAILAVGPAGFQPAAKPDRRQDACAPPSPDGFAPPIFSRAHLLDEIDNDEALMRRMIALFHENTPHLLAEIRGAIERGGAPDLARTAHALLSSLGAFGAHEARQLTRQLEACGQQSDLTHAKSIFGELERETARVSAALDNLLLPEIA